MSRSLLVVLGIVGVLVLALLMVGGSYVSARNQMVAKEQSVKSAWSEVDVQLQRRSDLIPNLVETVKGFASHETEVFKNIADARAATAHEVAGRIEEHLIAVHVGVVVRHLDGTGKEVKGSRNE